MTQATRTASGPQRQARPLAAAQVRTSSRPQGANMVLKPSCSSPPSPLHSSPSHQHRIPSVSLSSFTHLTHHDYLTARSKVAWDLAVFLSPRPNIAGPRVIYLIHVKSIFSQQGNYKTLSNLAKISHVSSIILCTFSFYALEYDILQSRDHVL